MSRTKYFALIVITALIVTALSRNFTIVGRTDEGLDRVRVKFSHIFIFAVIADKNKRYDIVKMINGDIDPGSLSIDNLPRAIMEVDDYGPYEIRISEESMILISSGKNGIREVNLHKVRSTAYANDTDDIIFYCDFNSGDKKLIYNRDLYTKKVIFMRYPRYTITKTEMR